MKRLSFLVMVLAIIALAMLTTDAAAQPYALTITVDPSGVAIASDWVYLSLNPPPPQVFCDNWSPYQTYNCPVDVYVVMGDTAKVVAEKITNLINSHPLCRDSGYRASVTGVDSNQVFIVGPSKFVCLMSSENEMLGCGGSGLDALYLDPDCDVNNVCNGIACDEAGPQLIQGLGHSFTAEESPPIPTVSEWGLIAVVVLLLVGGALLMVFRQKQRPANL